MWQNMSIKKAGLPEFRNGMLRLGQALGLYAAMVF